MGLAMLGRAGEVVLLQELLLAGEVHARELDEPVQALAHAFATLAPNEREADFIEGIH